LVIIGTEKNQELFQNIPGLIGAYIAYSEVLKLLGYNNTEIVQAYSASRH